MRFLIRVSFLCALALAVSASLFAQRGGVGAGHFAASGARGTSSFGSRALPATRGYSAPSAFRATSSGYGGIRSGALRSRGFRGREYRRLPYAYFFAPYYYPFLDYGSTPYSDAGYDQPYDSGDQASLMAENELGEQVQRLSAEVDQLAYGQQPQPNPAYVQRNSQPTPPAPPVMLVLHSGQQLEVQSYAVMDRNFWDFTKQPARKIPIDTIDIAASTKATQAKGGEFPQLDAGQ